MFGISRPLKLDCEVDIGDAYFEETLSHAFALAEEYLIHERSKDILEPAAVFALHGEWQLKHNGHKTLYREAHVADHFYADVLGSVLRNIVTNEHDLTFIEQPFQDALRQKVIPVGLVMEAINAKGFSHTLMTLCRTPSFYELVEQNYFRDLDLETRDTLKELQMAWEDFERLIAMEKEKRRIGYQQWKTKIE